MRLLRKRIITFIIASALMLSVLGQLPNMRLVAANAVSVSYRTHIQTYGWEGDSGDISTWKKDGDMSGTHGQSKRLEGIEIVVSGNSNLGIQYTTHCQTYGWLPWSADGEMNGTEGEAKRLEAIKIQLTGADTQKYDVYYRVHAQTYGWLSWAKNGQAAGTAGLAKRLEGIQIVVVPKGDTLPKEYKGITSNNDKAYISATGASDEAVAGADTTNVSYKTHVQTFGWQGLKYNGNISGTSGLAKRLEGINIKLINKQYPGGIKYRTHVQTYGWQDWVADGAMSGTSGESKRLESIQIYLTGDMAKHYDLYYRVHAQTYGWLGWSKNGEPSGTAGFGKRLEAIQIVLVKKNAAVPGDVGGITSVSAEGFKYKSKEQIPENPYVEPSQDNQNGESGDTGNSGSNNTGNTGNAGTGNTNSGSTGSNSSSNEGNAGSSNTGNTGSGSTGNTGSSSTGNTGSGSTGNTGSGSTGNTGSGSAGNTGSGSTGGGSNSSVKEKEPGEVVTDYTYKVTPLYAPFDRYFFVQTDNPDPSWVRFHDYDCENYDANKIRGSLLPTSRRFLDVDYEDEETGRVNGGYIFERKGYNFDGGELVVQQADVAYWENYGGITTSNTPRYEDTDITVVCDKVIPTEKYLIDEYTDESMTYFEKLDAVQSALNDLAVYPKYVQCTDKYTERPYPLLATGIHKELTLIPHYSMYENYVDGLLVLAAYPFVLDSLGFPGMMQTVAETLDSSCVVEDASAHHLVSITYDGETRVYGGAGEGSTNPIYSKYVEKLFLFDGSANDMATNPDMSKMRDKILLYGEQTEPDLVEAKKQVSDTVLKEKVSQGGSWLKVVGEGWFGYTPDEYTYVSMSHGNYQIVKHENVWVEGRYINEYNRYYAGATYEEYPNADIIVRNVEFTDYHGEEVCRDLHYMYCENDDKWYALNSYMGFKAYNIVFDEWDDESVQRYISYLPEEFILTRDMVEEMDVDKNTNKVPESGLIFDGTAEPGTPF